jgi:hypothetical protein
MLDSMELAIELITYQKAKTMLRIVDLTGGF